MIIVVQYILWFILKVRGQMIMGFYINQNVEKLDRIFDQNKREGFLRLDLNENPGGLPDEFIKEVIKDITPEFVAQYPETLEFTTILAEYLGVNIENICLVNGSSEGIRHIIEAYSRPGGKILGVTPTYAMFEVYPKMYGREYVPVHYSEDLELSVDELLEKMTSDIDLMIILNPNNPMGNVYSYEEMDRIVEKAKEKEITLLIDEAYIYFYPNEFLKYALENDHVFVTRTFSKLFSLAGCRLGYVVGRPTDIAIIQKLCTPHNVNAFAMKFAGNILKTDGLLDNLIKKQKEGKEYLIEKLESAGYFVNAKEGNFVFIKPKTDADKIVRRMKEEKGILIKAYNGIGVLGNCLRVTTGEKKYMELFIEALLELDR